MGQKWIKYLEKLYKWTMRLNLRIKNIGDIIVHKNVKHSIICNVFCFIWLINTVGEVSSVFFSKSWENLLWCCCQNQQNSISWIFYHVFVSFLKRKNRIRRRPFRKLIYDTRMYVELRLFAQINNLNNIWSYACERSIPVLSAFCIVFYVWKQYCRKCHFSILTD